MRPINEFTGLLDQFSNQYGLQTKDMQQGSATWLQVKLGVISASRASEAVAGVKTKTRQTYMCELVSEVCTGVVDELDGIRAMQWGKDQEDAARANYEWENKVKLVQIPFGFKDNLFRAGFSPDGLVPLIKGAEIKCPWDTTNYIKFVVDDSVKKEWEKQVQFSMWCSDAECWDVAMFDPRMKTKLLHCSLFKRDPEQMKEFDDLIPKFIDDMDEMLKKFGIKFGDHWKRIAQMEKSA